MTIRISKAPKHPNTNSCESIRAQCKMKDNKETNIEIQRKRLTADYESIMNLICEIEYASKDSVASIHEMLDYEHLLQTHMKKNPSTTI